jgi:type IV secretory pathway VirB2 component (pilin)
LAASVVVIVVHHLGYAGYRGKRMGFPVMGCSVLSLGYLLTASPIAAMGGHFILHVAMMRRGWSFPSFNQ